MLKNVLVKTWLDKEDPSWLIKELDAIAGKGPNYNQKSKDSVQQLIEDNILDSYSLIYRNGIMISGAGSRPNVLIPDFGWCYQIAVRGFRIPQQGLRQDYFTLDTLIPEQILRGQQKGFKRFIISFNLQNKRLIDNLDRNWKYPRIKSGPHTVNGVPQWVYLF